MHDPIAKDAVALHQQLDELVAQDLDDVALLDALVALGGRRALPFVFYRLARALLQRNPNVFGATVRSHLQVWGHDARGRLHRPWDSDHGQDDLAWLIAHAEARDDGPLFQAVMRLHFVSGAPDEGPRRFRDALMARFRRATGPHERVGVLARFSDLRAPLDDETALVLYDAEPDAARPFILRHLPWRARGQEDTDFLPGLLDHTRALDPAFHFELYRRLVGDTRWKRDVAHTLQEVGDDALVTELELRHPDRTVATAADVFADVLEQRGDLGLPYVMRHLDRVIRGGFLRDTGYRRLRDLAEERGHDELWARILRHAARPVEYNKEVRRLAAGPTDPQAWGRLLHLAGVGADLPVDAVGFAEAPPLDDATACAVFDADPALLEGPFRPQLQLQWSQPRATLIDRALSADRPALIDHLASRLVTRGTRSGGRGLLTSAEALADYYDGLRKDPMGFAERAAQVLADVPAHGVAEYDALLETNRLARLLYRDAAHDYLASARAIRGLLEAPEIHAQALAFRALALADPRALALAADHVDLLGATLRRPLRRRTRWWAIRALMNAAHSPSAAPQVLQGARDALGVADRRVPQEELVGLIGQVLHQHPALRGAREHPAVYRQGS